MTIETKYNIGQTVTLPNNGREIIDQIEITITAVTGEPTIKYLLEDYYDYCYEKELKP